MKKTSLLPIIICGLASAPSFAGLEEDVSAARRRFDGNAVNEEAVPVGGAIRSDMALLTGPDAEGGWPSPRIVPPEPQRYEKEYKARGRAIGERIAFIAMFPIGAGLVWMGSDALLQYTIGADPQKISSGVPSLFLFIAFILLPTAIYIGGGKLGAARGRRKDAQEKEKYLAAKQAEWKERLSKATALEIEQKKAEEDGADNAQDRFRL